MNHAKLTEKLKFNAEVLEISSAAGSTSGVYDMQGYQQAFIGFCIQGPDLSTVAVDLMETSATSAAGTSAAGSKAGIVIGGAATLVASTAGVTKLTISPTSATTAESFALTAGTVGPKTFTYTTSTALCTTASTSWTSTLAYFGSTLGTTVNTGVALSMDALKLAVEHQFPNVFAMSTPTTGSLGLHLMDDSKSGIGYNTTGATLPAAINQIVGGFNIDAEQLTSTASKRYIGIKVATCVTAADVSVNVVRASGRYGPPVFYGKLSS